MLVSEGEQDRVMVAGLLGQGMIGEIGIEMNKVGVRENRSSEEEWNR